MAYVTFIESKLFWVAAAPAFLVILSVLVYGLIVATWKARKKYIGDIARFKVLYPGEVKPEQSYPLLIFCTSLPPAITSDTNTPNLAEIEVQRRADCLLQDKRSHYYENNVYGSRRIPRGTYLKFSLNAKGIKFDHKQIVSNWDNELIEQRFKLKASKEYEGRRVKGTVKVAVWVVPVASLDFEVHITSSAACESFSVADSTFRRRIFPSYAREDAAVLTQFENIHQGSGDEYISDRKIPAGAEWEPKLLEYIAGADLFQLFWSDHAANSEYIRKELARALELNKEIRPVYWKEPPPPFFPEASKFQAKYIPLTCEQAPEKSHNAYLLAPLISWFGRKAKAATLLLAVSAIPVIGLLAGLWMASRAVTPNVTHGLAASGLPRVSAASPFPPQPGIYAISGRIVDAADAPKRNVTVTLSNGSSAQVLTDRNGNFTFATLKAGLKYRITPSSPGEDFSPAYREFIGLDKNEQADFRSVTFTISGVIWTQDGQPVEGVEVFLIGAGKARNSIDTMTTDKSGTYSFANIRKAFSYMVRPSKTDNTFTPIVQPLRHLDSSAVANFTMTPTPPRPPQIKVSTDKAGQPRKEGESMSFYVVLRNTGGSIAKNIKIGLKWDASLSKAFTLTPEAKEMIETMDADPGYVISRWIVEELPANKERLLKITATLKHDLAGEEMAAASDWIWIFAWLEGFEDEKGKKY
jgi:hypothetical protein